MNVNLDQVNELVTKYGDVVTNKQIMQTFRDGRTPTSLRISWPDYNKLTAKEFKVSRGTYNYSSVLNDVNEPAQSNDSLNAMAQVVDIKPVS